MKFIQFLQLVPDSQEMHLIYEGMSLHGEEETIGCMLCEDVYQGIVTDVEAEKDTLKVWVKEDSHGQEAQAD